MPSRSRAFAYGRQEIVKYEVSVVALNGNTYATLVSSPPDGVAYVVTMVAGRNTAGAARILELAFNENGTRTPIWLSASTADDAMFNQVTAGDESIPFSIVLSNTDESLDMRIDSTGTDNIYAAYETRET